MKRQSLKTRILEYLQRNEGVWIPKGKICDLARSRTGATGEHTGRRLRELAEEKLLKVKHIDNHAYYRYEKGTITKQVQDIQFEDGVAVLRYKTIEV